LENPRKEGRRKKGNRGKSVPGEQLKGVPVSKRRLSNLGKKDILRQKSMGG